MSKNIIEFTIVKLVRAKRDKMSLSQAKIATYLNVTAGYIGQIEMESSSSMYSYTQLNELAKLFKCSPREFMPRKAV